LLEACKQSKSPYLYLAVVLALSTGARKMEILTLRWQDVDLKRGVIMLHKTKNRERRALPLTGYALELMRQHGKVRRIGSDLVFAAGQDGQKPADIGLAWERAKRRAGITDFRFHDLRHTAASYLAMNGASLAEIAEILGHKTSIWSNATRTSRTSTPTAWWPDECQDFWRQPAVRVNDWLT
jgi:integrase